MTATIPAGPAGTGALPDLPGLALRRSEFWIRQSLRDVPIAGKSVLDIGAGSGLFTCYLALKGAHRVVALEPDGDGSVEAPRANLLRHVQALGLETVTCHADTLQAYDPGPERFDIVLANNVINHLDEASVQVLGHDPTARAAYAVVLSRMFDLLTPGGLAIIADCARDNLFGWLGLKNPLAPAIEWHKHQNPPVWSDLLESVGFERPSLHWTYPRRLRWLGPALDNRIVATMLESHFVLHARRPAARAAAQGRR